MTPAVSGGKWVMVLSCIPFVLAVSWGKANNGPQQHLPPQRKFQHLHCHLAVRFNPSNSWFVVVLPEGRQVCTNTTQCYPSLVQAFHWQCDFFYYHVSILPVNFCVGFLSLVQKAHSGLCSSSRQIALCQVVESMCTLEEGGSHSLYASKLDLPLYFRIFYYWICVINCLSMCVCVSGFFCSFHISVSFYTNILLFWLL